MFHLFAEDPGMQSYSVFRHFEEKQKSLTIVPLMSDLECSYKEKYLTFDLHSLDYGLQCVACHRNIWYMYVLM